MLDESVKETLKNLELWALWAFLAVIPGFLVLKDWRKNPNLGVAGFLTAIIFAAIATAVFGDKWALLALFIGTFAGPWVIMYVSNRENFAEMLDAINERLTKQVRGKDDDEEKGDKT